MDKEVIELEAWDIYSLHDVVGLRDSLEQFIDALVDMADANGWLDGWSGKDRRRLVSELYKLELEDDAACG